MWVRVAVDPGPDLMYEPPSDHLCARLRRVRVSVHRDHIVVNVR